MSFIDKLSKKERAGIFIAGAVVLAVFLDRLVIAPINSRIHRLDKETRVAEKELIGHLRNIKQKGNISKEYQKYMQYIKTAGSDEEETARILSEIEELARRSALDLVDMKPQASKTAGFYREYVVEVEAEGDEASVMKFLHNLNNSMQLLRAERVRLYQKDKNSPVVKSSILITKLVTS
ncbi:MAG: type 4a pilus biogenesis protein PilO [Candidatus Omnitrophota bacterium]